MFLDRFPFTLLAFAVCLLIIIIIFLFIYLFLIRTSNNWYAYGECKGVRDVFTE